MHIYAQTHIVSSYVQGRHPYHKNLYVVCALQWLQQTLINSTVRGHCGTTEALTPHTERKLEGLFKNKYLRATPRFRVNDVSL